MPLAPWLPPMTSNTGVSGLQAQRHPADDGVARLELGPDRRAGDGDVAMAEPRGGLGKTHEDLVDSPGEPAIGAAGNGVGFVKEGPGAEFSGRENRRCAGEAAHGQRGVRAARPGTVSWPRDRTG